MLLTALRYLLFPFSLLYFVVTWVRNKAFDVGVLKSTSYNFPVIAVGNLSVGGTGKTPQIEYLINLLKDKNKVAVLSRGYKRKTEGFVLLNDSHNVEDVGDEPLQFFTKNKNISVAVDANRVNGIHQLEKLVKPDLILLDDAYQHRKVKAGFYVLLTKFKDLYVNDCILPTGDLREGSYGAKRAHVVIVTKCPSDLNEKKQLEISRKLKLQAHQKLFFTTIDYHKTTLGKEVVSVEDLQNHSVVLVTGIANPTPLLQFLDDKNCRYKHLKYPDHHNFSEEEISQIKKEFESLGGKNKLLLTTEKDYMRLQSKMKGLSYLPIKTLFLSQQPEFDKAILDYCNVRS